MLAAVRCGSVERERAFSQGVGVGQFILGAFISRTKPISVRTQIQNMILCLCVAYSREF